METGPAIPPGVAHRGAMAEIERDAYAEDDARWSAMMARAQAGEESAYRQLLGELAGVVSRYLLSRLGPREFLDDCVQEVLIAVHQARHTYDPRRKFRPWLFAIVRHKAIDTLRRQQSHRRLLDRERQAVHQYNQQQSSEDSLAGGRLIQALSPEHREAITLTKIVGLSTREAAARLAISESALKLRVYRATKNLRRMMEADTP